jgi:hypothetical protein
MSRVIDASCEQSDALVLLPKAGESCIQITANSCGEPAEYSLKSMVRIAAR